MNPTTVQKLYCHENKLEIISGFIFYIVISDTFIKQKVHTVYSLNYKRYFRYSKSWSVHILEYFSSKRKHRRTTNSCFNISLFIAVFPMFSFTCHMYCKGTLNLTKSKNFSGGLYH